MTDGDRSDPTELEDPRFVYGGALVSDDLTMIEWFDESANPERATGPSSQR